MTQDPEAALQHARMGFGLEGKRDVRPLRCDRLSVLVENPDLQGQDVIERPVALSKRQLPAGGLDEHLDVRHLAEPFVRNRRDAERQPCLRQRARDGRHQLRGESRCGVHRLGGCGLELPARRRVALAKGNLRLRIAVYLHCDLSQLAVALLVRGVIPEDVVRTVLLDDAVERLVHVVGADGGHAARFLCELAQVHLRRLQLLSQRLRSKVQRQERQPLDLDVFLRHGGEAARIDRIDLHVAA